MLKQKMGAKKVGEPRIGGVADSDEPLDLVATMAHELKTPLTLIAGLAQMLESGQFGKLNAKQKRYVERIEGVADRLLALIESLLAMSRSEQRIIQPELEAVSIPAIVASVVAELESHISQRELKLNIQSKRSMAPVLADRETLYQIIYNLVDNAIKYSPPKTAITIKYRHQAGWLELLLSDQGVGIKPSEIEHLFKRFGKIGRPLAGQASSTGLGLYIVKKLVEAQGGHITVQALKAGSCFIVRLPLVQQLPLFVATAETKQLTGKAAMTTGRHA